jgi:DNA-binding CsgD family transcriptional regulator
MVWPRRIAAGAAALSAALLLLSAAFAVMAPSSASIVNLALGLAVAPVSAVLGVVIAGRPLAPRVGVLLAAVALAVSAIVARETGAQVLAGRPDASASLSWLVAIQAEGAVWILVAIGLLLLHFPDGRLPGQRWRWVPGVAIAAAQVTQGHGAFDSGPFRPPLEHLDRPFGPPPLWLELLGLIGFVTLLTTVIACAISLILRFRRSDRIARAQIKWLAIGGLGIALYPLVCGVEILATGSPGWISAAVGVAGLVGIPVATAIAILRHDLYDVDKALAGTVAWGVLTTILVGIYGLTSLAAGVVFGQGSAAFAAATTALCALALSPLRHRLQGVVDRRLYPRRRAAFAALDALYEQVSSGQAQPEAPLLKDRVFDVDDFLDALRRVASGGSALDPEVVGMLLGPTHRSDPLALLTRREREVLALMAEGRTNAGIAHRLFLTERTIETHVASIMSKLGLTESAHEHRRVLAVLAWLGVPQKNATVD